MEIQRFIICLIDSLEDVEDNAGEAICIEIDFLIVGYLTDLTKMMSRRTLPALLVAFGTYLTSAKLDGSEAMMAPPKSSVVLN